MRTSLSQNLKAPFWVNILTKFSNIVKLFFEADPLSVLGMSLETNRCKPNQTYVWCLPYDYNQEKHPFTCKFKCTSMDTFKHQFFYKLKMKN